MSKKIDRALYGPSWVEVFFGALLSVILGIVLAVAYLVAKPVAVVKELPVAEEREGGMVYLVEGSRDATKGKQWKVKQQQFMAGHSVALTEDELNAAVAALTAPAPAKPEPSKAPAHPKKNEPAKKADAPPAAESLTAGVKSGVPNFRIRDGAMQIAMPVTLNALTLNLDVPVQARGGFEKRGDHYVFVPSTLLIGSLPVDRIPVLSGFVLDKFYAGQTFPVEITTAWEKLSQVSIDGAQLKLVAP